MPAEKDPSPPSQDAAPGLVGAHDSDSLVLLKRFAQAAGVDFDRGKAERVVRQAERDIPPTVARAARRRLAQAAEAIGLLLLSRQLSIREAFAAVAPKSPFALFAVTADGSARWFLLVDTNLGKGRFVRLASDSAETTMHADEFARSIGVVDGDDVVEWILAQPTMPLSLNQGDTTTSPHTEDDPSSHGPSPVRRLGNLVLSERRDLRTVVIYAIGIGILSLAVPITAMAVVNTTAMATLLQQLVVLCLALFVSLGLAAVLRGVQMVVVEYLQQRVFVRLVADLAYRLPRVDLKTYDRQHGPELINRFFDVLIVQKAAATLLLEGIDIALQMAIGFLLLAFYHHLLLGFTIILIAGLFFIVFVLGRGAVSSAIHESHVKYVVAGWIEEMARHPAAFKLHGGPQFAQERADTHAREYLLARQQHFWIVFRQFWFGLALQVIASTALLGLGGYLVIVGQLTLGQLVAAEIIVTLVVASFTKFGKQLENYYDLLAALEKVGHLLEIPLERQTGEAHHPRTGGASVKVHNVSFAYEPGRKLVLNRFNLTLQPGERVALVGPNGAGKSTLIDLLFGSRTPTDGHISIDEADLRDMRLQSLREHIAIVKGIEIFGGTLLDNIRMGRDQLAVADIRNALFAVGLLEDVLDLPEGMNTPLGTGGAPLSLGQCERLMLARAIVDQPRLLILDEMLDDMDQEVRHEVMPAILGKEARWTLLVVTHSQGVAKLCERQVRMQKARSGDRTNVASNDHMDVASPGGT